MVSEGFRFRSSGAASAGRVARAGRRRRSRAFDGNGDPIHQARVDRRWGGRYPRAVRRAAGAVRLPQDGQTRQGRSSRLGRDPWSTGLHPGKPCVPRPAPGVRDLGWSVVGLSSQASDEQKEASVTLHLPFPLLADSERQLGAALRLPTFEAAGMTLYSSMHADLQATDARCPPDVLVQARRQADIGARRIARSAPTSWMPVFLAERPSGASGWAPRWPACQSHWLNGR
jgi:hypothetical protein